MNKFARIVRKNKTAAAGALASLAASSHAALPAGAEAAISGYGADVVSAIGLATLAGLTIYAAKKLGQKMGWL